MEPKPGNETSEWAGLKWLALAASLATALGGILIESGLVQKDTTVYLLITAIISLAGAYAKYSGGRALVKAETAKGAAFAEASKPGPTSSPGA